MEANRPAGQRMFRALSGSGKPGPAGKQQAILAELRGRITRGDFVPGARIPTKVELSRAFKVNGLTIQWAVARLCEEGFLQTRGAHGTFVADPPPHLHRIMLVLDGPGDDGGNHLGALLHRRFRQFADAGESGLEWKLDVAKPENYEHLLEDVRCGRVAGIFCESPYLPSRGKLADLLQQTGVPCVAIASGRQHYEPTITRLISDHFGFIEAALGRLAEKGCRRVAFIENSLSDEQTAATLKSAHEHGLTIERRHMLAIDPRRPSHARPLAELLLHSQPKVDAVVIGDDSLVEPASKGFVDAGVGGKSSLSVVAHANFPFPSPCAVPATRLGVDLDEAIGRTLEIIRGLRRGTQFPRVLELTPRAIEN